LPNDLKSVGLSFKADGAVDFKKSLSEVNNAVNENRSAFKLAKSEWDKGTSSAEKLRATQEYLQNQTEAYTAKRIGNVCGGCSYILGAMRNIRC